jgi:K+/H+ antiporter YhaU regulatory subunit KhtT
VLIRVPMPDWLAGRSLADSRLGSETGCNVLGLVRAGSDRVEPPPAATEPLPRDAALVLIGDAQAQERLYARDGE